MASTWAGSRDLNKSICDNTKSSELHCTNIRRGAKVAKKLGNTESVQADVEEYTITW